MYTLLMKIEETTPGNFFFLKSNDEYVKCEMCKSKDNQKGGEITIKND